MSRKISQMTEATEIKSGDISVVVQDGETKQFPLDLLVTKEQADGYKTVVETQLADYEQEITDIKNKYDKELYSPTITVTNTSMVKTGQGDAVDYSASVEDSIAKSAILKGNTLVNLINVKNATGGIVYTTKDLNLAYELPVGKYILFYDIIKANTSSGLGKPDRHTPAVTFNDGTKIYQGFEGFNTSNGKKYWIINATTPIVKVEYWLANLVEDGEVDNLRLFAYQDGMENWDIPYFAGMQSVKMPVLTTTGKNLFNTINKDILVSPIIEEYSIANNEVFIKTNQQGWGNIGFDFNVAPNKIHTLKYESQIISGDPYITISIRDKDGNVLDSIKNQDNSLTFTTPIDGILRLRFYCGNDTKFGEVKYTNIQLEESLTATSYEPFKSNILSTSEDVELRGIGDVKDELNLLTGEVVERIGEIVLDGSQTLQPHSTVQGDTLMIKISDPSISFKQNSNLQESWDLSDMICDKEPIAETPKWNANEWNEGYNIVLISSALSYPYDINSFVLAIRKSYFNVQSIDEFKTWLTQNPLTIQYKLAKESIKTVVLNPSGTLASKTPYMWKNGNIQLSSDGLIPCLDYAVITSRVGVIENNMSETIANEKRIHSLEVILAQSTISAANDAVLLQSDLEATTMSVDGAQLDTGNTQDDFLYEMVLLLIEKNAYDESLFDKVCTFYLYGKLSDEQFTNIYNLLYPMEE